MIPAKLLTPGYVSPASRTPIPFFELAGLNFHHVDVLLDAQGRQVDPGGPVDPTNLPKGYILMSVPAVVVTLAGYSVDRTIPGNEDVRPVEMVSVGAMWANAKDVASAIGEISAKILTAAVTMTKSGTDQQPMAGATVVQVKPAPPVPGPSPIAPPAVPPVMPEAAEPPVAK